MKQTDNVIKLPRIVYRGYCAALLVLIVAVTTAAQTATSPATKPEQSDNEYQVGAVIWTQSAAEARALRYQAYSLARLALDRDLRTNRSLTRKRAVVVDVDETVLDNSRYQAELILKHQPYTSASWTAWCQRAEADAIPGAVEFLRYAASRGVRVFYITNRRVAEKEGTIINLKRLNFPDVSDETVLVRIDGAGKEPRRQQIRQRFRVVLLVGDNLADFSDFYEGKSTQERAAAVDAERTKFGAQLIVLPNPMYGDWESAVYGYNVRLSEEAKAAKRREALRGY